MTSRATGTTGRYPLGPQEHLFRTVFEDFDGDGQVTVAFRLIGILEQGPLEQALRLLHQRHPKLRALIGQDPDGTACLEITDAVPVPALTVEDFASEDLPWEARSLASSARKVNAQSGPLWRVELLRSRSHRVCEILITAHHIIIDGVSVFRLLDDLLGFYHQIQVDGVDPAAIAASIQPTPAVMTSELPVRAPLFKRMRALVAMIRQFAERKRGNWAALPASPQGHAPHWSRVSLSAEQNELLKQRAREHAVTIGTLLPAIALMGVARALAQPVCRLRCNIAVGVRDLYEPPIPGDCLGCFVSGFDSSYRVATAYSVWDLAANIRARLQRFLQGGGPAMTTHLIKRIDLKQGYRPPKRPTLGVSNLKIAAVKAGYGDLVLDGYSEVGRNRMIGPSLNLTAVEINGALHLGHGTAGVADAFRAAYHRQFQSILEQLCEGDRPA